MKMTLQEAVIMGKFCGLETVEECVRNIQYHFNMFSYKEYPVIWEALLEQYFLWKEGKLTLDWDFIRAEVAAEYKAYEESERNRAEQEHPEPFNI